MYNNNTKINTQRPYENIKQSCRQQRKTERPTYLNIEIHKIKKCMHKEIPKQKKEIQTEITT